MLAVRSNGEGSSRLCSALLATFLLDSFYDTCIDHGWLLHCWTVRQRHLGSAGVKMGDFVGAGSCELMAAISNVSDAAGL